MHNEHLTDDLDSQLTDFGVYQAVRTGMMVQHLIKNIDKFECLTSPYLRCLRTADLIKSYCQKLGKFKVCPIIHEATHAYPADGCKVPNRKIIFNDFDWSDCPKYGWHFEREKEPALLRRMKKTMKELPDEALVISHGTPVMILALLAMGSKVDTIPEWDGSIINCSFTLVEDGKLRMWGNIDHLC